MTSVSIVIPVYKGEHSLPILLQHIDEWRERATQATIDLKEVVLVNDGAVDNSADVMLRLADQFTYVRNVWLSRNFGQHPATVAGIAITTGEWVVTMDEDGLHNPDAIDTMIEAAHRDSADLVYATAANSGVPHSAYRNLTSRAAKSLIAFMGETDGSFTSFRLIDGSIARSIAAFYAPDTYLDIALGWVVARASTVSVEFRTELRPGGESGYSTRRLLSHMRRLIISSGMRPLRIVGLLGMCSMLVGVILTVWVVIRRLTGGIDVAGWSSLIALISLGFGMVLLVLGLIAEYLAVALHMAQGRPAWLAIYKPPRRIGAPTPEHVDDGDD